MDTITDDLDTSDLFSNQAMFAARGTLIKGDGRSEQKRRPGKNPSRSKVANRPMSTEERTRLSQPWGATR